MDGAAFDLADYLGRIGHSGRPAADLATLRALHRLHPAAIAFENLDPFLGRPVRLDSAALVAKLVVGGRGGYCFEQNHLFMLALSALGFAVSGLAARVLWNQPPGAVTPRSHMLLRVSVDGETWIADVGFGGMTLTSPLRLVADIEQQTPHGRCRLVEAAGYWRLEAVVAGEWRAVYRFDLSEHLPPDYGLANYFASTNPASPFVGNLIAARALPDRRLTLLNDRLTVHGLDDGTTQRRLSGAVEIADVLAELFAVEVPDRAALAAALSAKGGLVAARG